jgi:nitroreductase
MNLIEDKLMLKELIMKNRSYRRFYQDEKIDITTLKNLIDLARLSASASNKQALKFYLSCEPLKNELIFGHLSWAAYLKDWPGPEEGEKPSAYIIILGDKEINNSFGCDHGIAAQSILLGAVEIGYGGCMIGSIKKESLLKSLDLTDRYEVLLVIALGKPKETIVIEKIGADGNIKYFRDSEGIHHVPKRDLDELIIS